MNESTLPVDTALSQEDWRVPLPSAFSVSVIHTMGKDQLLSLQKLAGWGSEWGIIDTPKDRLRFRKLDRSGSGLVATISRHQEEVDLAPHCFAVG